MTGPMRSPDQAQERAIKRPGTPYVAYRLNLTGDDCGVALVVGYITHDESGEEIGVEACSTPLTFAAATELRDTPQHDAGTHRSGEIRFSPDPFVLGPWPNNRARPKVKAPLIIECLRD